MADQHKTPSEHDEIVLSRREADHCRRCINLLATQLAEALAYIENPSMSSDYPEDIRRAEKLTVRLAEYVERLDVALDTAAGKP